MVTKREADIVQEIVWSMTEREADAFLAWHALSSPHDQALLLRRSNHGPDPAMHLGLRLSLSRLPTRCTAERTDGIRGT